MSETLVTLDGIISALEEGIQRNDKSAQMMDEKGILTLAHYHKGVRDGYEATMNSLIDLRDISKKINDMEEGEREV